MAETPSGASEAEATKPIGAETTTPPAVTTPSPVKKTGDRDPFHIGVVDTTVETDPVNVKPSDNLELEQNYPTNEEINNLIRSVRTREWRHSMEQSRMMERYNHGQRSRETTPNNPERRGRLERFRGRLSAFLGGEHDFDVVTENGRIYANRNLRNEITRKVINIAWKTGTTAAFIGAIGLLTGGVGAIAVGSLAGSAIARAGVETARSFGDEVTKREELAISREAHYDKVEQLADRIGPADPPNIENMSDREISEYHRDRNNAIRSLVDLVYNSDRQAVALKRDESGRMYYAGGPVGEPLPPDMDPGAPPPGGPDGPTTHTGTEVYQQSERAPAPRTLNDLEEGLEKSKQRWDKIEEVMAFAGGIAGGIATFLHGQTRFIAETTAKLARGEIVPMDINGDGILHGVQKVTTAMAEKFHISSPYVWFHQTIGEKVLAQAAHNPIFSLPGGDFGARILNDSFFGALYRAEHLKEAIPIIGGLLGRLIQRTHTRAGQEKNFSERRALMRQEEEKSRKRWEPENRTAQLMREANDRRKPYPEPGQEWIISDGNGGFHRIEILKMFQDKQAYRVEVRRFDPNGGDAIREIINIEDIIFDDDARCVERREKEGVTPNPYDRDRPPVAPPEDETPAVTSPNPPAPDQPDLGGGEELPPDQPVVPPRVEPPVEPPKVEEPKVEEETSPEITEQIVPPIDIEKSFQKGEIWLPSGESVPSWPNKEGKGDQVEFIGRSIVDAKIIKTLDGDNTRITVECKNKGNYKFVRTFGLTAFIRAFMPKELSEKNYDEDTLAKTKAEYRKWAEVKLEEIRSKTRPEQNKDQGDDGGPTSPEEGGPGADQTESEAPVEEEKASQAKSLSELGFSGYDLNNPRHRELFSMYADAFEEYMQGDKDNDIRKMQLGVNAMSDIEDLFRSENIGFADDFIKYEDIRRLLNEEKPTAEEIPEPEVPTNVENTNGDREALVKDLGIEGFDEGKEAQVELLKDYISKLQTYVNATEPETRTDSLRDLYDIQDELDKEGISFPAMFGVEMGRDRLEKLNRLIELSEENKPSVEPAPIEPEKTESETGQSESEKLVAGLKELGIEGYDPDNPEHKTRLTAFANINARMYINAANTAFPLNMGIRNEWDASKNDLNTCGVNVDKFVTKIENILKLNKLLGTSWTPGSLPNIPDLEAVPSIEPADVANETSSEKKEETPRTPDLVFENGGGTKYEIYKGDKWKFKEKVGKRTKTRTFTVEDIIEEGGKYQIKYKESDGLTEPMSPFELAKLFDSANASKIKE